MVLKTGIGRKLHLLSGLVLGAAVFGPAAVGLGLKFQWSAVAMTVFGVAGTVFYGYMAMRHEDAYWAWFGRNNHRWR